MSTAPKRILFVVAHRPGRSPGQRFRFEQYLSFLKEDGFDVTISYIISEVDDKIFYQKGHLFHKAVILLKGLAIRMKDVYRARDYDIVFIYREAIMIGFTMFEQLFRYQKAKIILDFDDAIWLNDVSPANYYLKWLKRPSKTKTLIKLSHLTITGNAFLAKYALQFNDHVTVFPTTIDLNYYKKNSLKPYKQEQICIGWTGSTTTIKHLETALPFLQKLQNLYGNRIHYLFISDLNPQFKNIKYEFRLWNINTEIDDLSQIDIGIMPLPDDEWSRGKCGFKGIQFMALGISTIMSPVGVNKDIIKEDENGYLASTENEWIEKLSRLIESDELRKRIGRAGRETIAKKYSCQSLSHIYVNIFNQLLTKA